MSIVEMRRRREGDEKLPAVGVRPTVRHRENARARMTQLRVKLVRERVTGAPNPLTQRIASLDHEAVDYPVKNRPVVVRRPDLLTRTGIAPLLGPLCKPDKILDRSRRF